MAVRLLTDVNQLSFVGGDLKTPTRNFPRVINAAMAIVLLFTLFANIAYFAALGFDAVAQSTTVGLVGTSSSEEVLLNLANIGFRHSAIIS